MNAPHQPTSVPRNRKRGLALVTVVSMLVVLTVLAVAILSISDSERRSSVKYADGEFARNLADAAINVAMGQIWEGARQEGANGETTLWASQPGAIRKYNNNGSFLRGYKLYTDDQMIVEGNEELMIQDHPDATWQTKPGKWVDLNEPVIRPDMNNDGQPEVIFPIIDPRAFVRTELEADNTNRVGSSNVEGFSYEKKTGTTTVDWVKDATNVSDPNARLPMPVQWLYVLKNGTLGHVTEGTNPGEYNFVGAGGVVPTADNPIVGRIAMWTDDETSKININTAGEPTFWAPPFAYHDRDYQFAVYQPTRFEYQRYPGHPATVAMSTVLFPNQDMDTYGKTGSARETIIERKERIYDIMPKINRGGSKAATVPFWALSDPEYKGTKMYRVDVSESLRERLYASVDELLFSEEVGGDKRLTQDSVPSNPVPLFSANTAEARSLERMRFFLTAHSRAPETTMFGTPRVAMWPVANETNIGPMSGDPKSYRTVFDNLVAFCGTVQSATGTGNSYFFRRADSMSPTTDVDRIPRNRQLLDYLYSLMQRKFPSGGQTAASFTDKYPSGDAAQILTEIFDYIRSTNLYDGALAPSREELIAVGSQYRMNGLSTKARLDRRDSMRGTMKTYTPSRASDNVDLSYSDAGVTQPTLKQQMAYSAFPGHGQVTPIQTTIGGHQTRGFGRFPTISEVGLHFICTADGATDDGSWRIMEPDPANPGSYIPSTLPADISGGRTSSKLSNTGLAISGNHAITEQMVHPVTGLNTQARWYSNFPPYPARGSYGTDPAVSATHHRHYSKHPGFNPVNWNVTLTRNTPLPANARRVQAMLSLELTVPASGYTGLFPDMCITVEGLPNLRMTAGSPLPIQPFQSTLLSARRTWRGPSSLFHTTHNREGGGSVGPAALTQSRRVVRSGAVDMPDDTGYEQNVAATGTTNEGATNYDLVSNFFTVIGDSMTFTGGSLTINLYSSRNMSEANKVQTFTVSFPSTSLPVPELVVIGSPREEWTSGTTNNVQERIEAPRWWAFNWGGAIGRFSHNPAAPWDGQSGEPGRIEANDINPGNALYNQYKDWGVESGRTLGRFFTKGSGHGSRHGVPKYDSLMWLATNNTEAHPTAGNYGTFTTPERLPTIKTGPPGNSGYVSPDVQGPFGQDVVISLVPKHGDIRLIAAKKDVPASDWEAHPGYGKVVNGLRVYGAHSFMRYVSDYEAGIDLKDYSSATPAINYNRQLVYGARYRSSARPDLPATSLVDLARRYGDFDSGIPNLRDGPWINKPDEGNTGLEYKGSAVGTGGLVRTPTAYFDEMWRGEEAGESFMSPNRMISSPGMFGSLSVGVKSGDPWRTLLFRPYVPSSVGDAASSHPGSPNYGGTGANSNTAHTPFKGVNPADHLLMDLFWMPIVEPYAISEPFSTAGKVNLNYQMVPFNSYIRRATGLHAVLKGEEIQAHATANVQNIQAGPDGRQYVSFDNGYGQYHQMAKWADLSERATNAYYTHATPRLRFWHRKIDIDSKTPGPLGGNASTLGQFDDRFNFAAALPAGARGLFRVASQICEIHLVPKKVSGSEGNFAAGVVNAGAAPNASDGSDSNPATKYSYKTMGQFWDPRTITGDNLKERPYANIYAKVTTKSNTFRVHYRAQAITKARSVAPNVVNVNLEPITSDYRGSALIERRIDPEDPRIPNYGVTPNSPSLEQFYNFRVLENKRFFP
jgi:uncharacterized protein (TIGR02600 family)